jgi:hypothetical protein
MLPQTAQRVLRHRSAGPQHVCLSPAPRRRPLGTPHHASPSGDLASASDALPAGYRWGRRLCLPLVLARRPVGPRRDALWPRPCALSDSPPRRHGHKRHERRPQACRAPPWGPVPASVWLACQAARDPCPAAAPPASDTPTGGVAGPSSASPEPGPLARERDKGGRHSQPCRRGGAVPRSCGAKAPSSGPGALGGRGAAAQRSRGAQRHIRHAARRPDPVSAPARARERQNAPSGPAVGNL